VQGLGCNLSGLDSTIADLRNRVRTQEIRQRCNNLITQGDRARNSGQYQEALSLYREAQRQGCQSSNLDRSIADTENAIREQQTNQQRCNDLINRGNAAWDARQLRQALNLYQQARQQGCQTSGLDQAIADLQNQISRADREEDSCRVTKMGLQQAIRMGDKFQQEFFVNAARMRGCMNDPEMQELIRQVTNAGDDAVSPSFPNLAGNWICTKNCPAGGEGKTARIAQEGSRLHFTNEGGSTSEGQFIDRDTVTATQWGNLRATIRDGGRVIDWSNGTEWARRTPGQEQPRRQPPAGNVTGPYGLGCPPMAGNMPLDPSSGGHSPSAMNHYFRCNYRTPQGSKTLLEVVWLGSENPDGQYDHENFCRQDETSPYSNTMLLLYSRSKKLRGDVDIEFIDRNWGIQAVRGMMGRVEPYARPCRR
jgi:hypothetical protein